MVVAAQKAGLSKDFWEKTFNLSRLKENPFDSDRKCMSVVCGPEKSIQEDYNQNCFILAKGGPENLLHRCTSFAETFPFDISSLNVATDDNVIFEINEQTLQYEVQPLNEEILEEISNRAANMASSGVTCFSFGYTTY